MDSATTKPNEFPEDRPETEAERQHRLAREDVMIDQALASAAAGRTVSFEAVKAWVDSWDTDHELPQPRSGR
jgi:predicted transcriptional regulator